MTISADRAFEDLYAIACDYLRDEIDCATFDRRALRYMPPELLPVFRKTLDYYLGHDEQRSLIRRFVWLRLATVEVNRAPAT